MGNVYKVQLNSMFRGLSSSSSTPDALPIRPQEFIGHITVPGPNDSPAGPDLDPSTSCNLP